MSGRLEEIQKKLKLGNSAKRILKLYFEDPDSQDYGVIKLKATVEYFKNNPKLAKPETSDTPLTSMAKAIVNYKETPKNISAKPVKIKKISDKLENQPDKNTSLSKVMKEFLESFALFRMKLYILLERICMNNYFIYGFPVIPFIFFGLYSIVASILS